LENSGIFGFPDQILQDARIEHFKAHKTGTVPENPRDEWDPDL
jgi:hypothetical protein